MIENIAHTKGLYGAAVNGNFIVKEGLCHALLRLIIDADLLADTRNLSLIDMCIGHLYHRRRLPITR